MIKFINDSLMNRPLYTKMYISTFVSHGIKREKKNKKQRKKQKKIENFTEKNHHEHDLYQEYHASF